MPRTFTSAITICWLASAILGAVAGEEEPKVQLTDSQREFISKKAPIRVGITPEWAPFSYFVNGEGRGIDVDVLNLISQRTGLRYELLPENPPWNVIWQLAQKGEVDVTSSTIQTREREKVFRFTGPYAESISVIVARPHDLRFAHLSLLGKARLAQPRSHLVSIALTNRLPTLSVLWLETQGDCFEAVARNKADVTVADLFTATHYMNDHPHEKLTICGVIPDFRFPLRFAVRRDSPVLVDILNQGLASISQEEMDAIVTRHLLFTLQGGRRVALLKQRLAYVVIAALVVTGLILLWNRILRKETRARRSAEAELRDVNRSLEIFSHSIAHDIRSPLRAISGFAEALQQDYGPKLDEVGNDYLRRINAASERMESLITDVLAYSQATRAQFVLRKVSLKQVVSELLGEFPPEQRPYFHIASELPSVWAHPALLGQCLVNLFSNAVKYVPAGRTPDIRIWTEQKGTRIRVWVEDNGSGIAPEDRERIFKLFQRGSHPSNGTGIGLAVVAKGIERMRGRVGVESELNQGSRFWIELMKPPSDDDGGS